MLMSLLVKSLVTGVGAGLQNRGKRHTAPAATPTKVTAKTEGLARETAWRASDSSHKLALRGKRPHDLSPSVTGVHLFTSAHQPERRQYPDIPSDRRPVSFEDGGQLRNRRRFPSYCVENTNSLNRQHAQQVGGIFECQAHFRQQSVATIQLLRTSCRSPEKSIGGARAHSFESLNRLVYFVASRSSRLQSSRTSS
jgi:hypothetical protein